MNKDFKFIVRGFHEYKDWSSDKDKIITEKTNNGFQFYNEVYTLEEFEAMYQAIHKFRNDNLI